MKLFRPWHAAAACLMTLTALPAAAYDPGYTWRRSADWTEGTTPGTSLGNPAPDQSGNAAWRYGALTGDAAGSDNPWFENEAQLMVWDNEWWGSNGAGVWARDYFGPGADNDDANPPIGRWRMTHDVSQRTHSFEYTSAVDWLNPVGDGAIVDVSGQLVFQWNGAFTDASPLAPVEGVVARFDASSGQFDTLWSGTFTNPSAGGPMEPDASEIAPIELTGVRFDDGDYLRFSLRMQGGESPTSLWASMRDEIDLRLVAVVPEPGTAAMWLAGLVGLAGVTARRRAA